MEYKHNIVHCDVCELKDHLEGMKEINGKYICSTCYDTYRKVTRIYGIVTRPNVVMNDKEYRKLAFFTFPMLENLLYNLYTTIQNLDNKTYSERITERKEKRGKKMVTVIGNTPLTQEQIYNHIESKGYISTLVAIRSLIDRLTPNAWNLEQVADFIHQQPEELQENIWMLYKFENCNYDNSDNRSVSEKLESCKYALEHCEQFMSGTGIMDKINSMLGYVLVQVSKNINYLLGVL